MGNNTRGNIAQDQHSKNKAPPSMAPPPLPPDYGNSGGSGPIGWSSSTTAAATSVPISNPAPPPAQPVADDDWGWSNDTPSTDRYQNAPADDPWSANAAPNNSDNNYNQAYDQDDWDSDFDDDVGGQSTMTHNANQTSSGGLLAPKNSALGGSMGDVSSMRSEAKKQSAAGFTSFNRFSTFVKSGGESFVLGKLNANVQESDVIQVVDSGDGKFSWLNVKPPYNCAIASPKKESKLKGLKSFIAYQLTPSFNNIQVSRRYKHFDWLHERLVEKYTFVPIPPLPDKQIQGRYEEEFIEHRMNQLQSFVDRVCHHPVLSQSEVWQHFLTCTDEKRWKAGKRKSEKDPLVGGNVFMTIRTPERPMDPDTLDHEVDVFSKFSNSFDAAVKNMHKTAADQTQKCQKYYKMEFQTIGKAFQQLGNALQQDGNYLNPNLTNAITCTGEAYEDIGKMYEDQPRNDWEPLGDVMHDYRGLLMGWPGILQIHAGAISKKKEFEKMASEGKVNPGESTEISNRTNTLSFALMAEINTFHHQRVKDMKTAHQHFLQEQIAFYHKVIEKLQDSLRMFDNC